MAFTATTEQTLVFAAEDKLRTALQQLEQYALTNNQALLDQTDAALVAAAEAITALRA